MDIIGINIQRLRSERKLTLRDLSKRLNVTASFLSQVETGKANPSLVTLKEIATALGTTVGELLGEQSRSSYSPVMREADRPTARKIGERIRMTLLTSSDPTKQMEPILFRLDKGATSGSSLYKHFGQEFILVIKGCMEISLNDMRYILKKGDTIYFNSSTPHTFRNIHPGETEALWVVTPPSF